MDEVVKECDVISVTPKTMKLKESVGRHSTRERRISTGSLLFSDITEKIIPHYLRPSSGSCHDFCKYGKKDASEVVVKHSSLCRSLSTKIVRDKKQNQSETLNPGDRIKKLPLLGRSLSTKVIHAKDRYQSASLILGESKKKQLSLRRSASSKTFQDKYPNQFGSLNLGERRKEIVKSRPLPHLKSEVSDKWEVNKKTLLHVKDSELLEKHANIKLRARTPSRGSRVSFHEVVLTCPENELNKAESGPISSTKKREAIKQNTTYDSKISPAKLKIVKPHGTPPVKETEVDGEPGIIDVDIASPAKISTASIEHNRIRKMASSLMNKPSSEKAFSHLERIDLPAKTVITLKRRKTTAVKPMLLLKPAWGYSVRAPQKAKMAISEKGEDKLLKAPFASISPKTPLDSNWAAKPRKFRKQNNVSSIKSQDKRSNDMKNKISCTIDSKLGSSQLAVIQTEQKSNKITKGEEKRRPRVVATVHPVEYRSKPHRLRSGRVKAVDIPETGSPRRLRFKKARFIRENSNGDGKVGTISMKKAAPAVSLSVNSGPEAQAVLLRHQDTQVKKESQGLLNHVIEETVTMLEEKRKSKVEALVGAFETVISLQDSKHSSAV